MANLKFPKLNKKLFSFVYIKENTKLSDLKYKEEIFEFLAYNHNTMQERELNEIILKMMNFKILKSEAVEFKNLLRNLMMCQNVIQSKEVIRNFLTLISNKLDDINEFINDEYEANNFLDKDFSQIFSACFSFINKNIHLLEKNDILDLFKLITKVSGLTEESLTQAFILLLNVNQVEPFTFDQHSEIVLTLLKLIKENDYKKIIENQIRDYLFEYIAKFKTSVNEFVLSQRQNCLELDMTKILYCKIVGLLKHVDKESNVALILNELVVIKNKLEKLFIIKKINPRLILSNYDYLDDQDNKGLNEALLKLDNIAI
jgi:hypothetical protein